MNFIREAYYLDDRSLPWIQERLHPQCSLSMLWRIARGRARQDVPLSPRLQAAVDADEAARAASERRLAEESRRPLPPDSVAPLEELEDDAELGEIMDGDEPAEEDELLGDVPRAPAPRGPAAAGEPEGEDWA